METKGIMPNMLQGNVFLRCAVGAQEILSSDMIQHVLTGVPLQELRRSKFQPARNQHERYYVILYYYCVCPSLGTHINLAKCELFSHFGNSMFPPAVKFSHHPNLEILGAPTGDYLYCSKFIAGKCADARKLLSSLVDVAAVDPHVALSLLRLCGSYCRLVHG